jgi:hypothetical protein
LFAAISREPAEILKVNPSNGSVVGRIPVSGPIGGLEYDNDRSILLAQIFRDIPHIAVINPRTGRTQETMWSDESAMGLAKVQGDLLCSWASGFDQHAFGDLRLLDPATGRVRGRLRTNEILTAMAPLSKKVAGIDGFIALTVLDPLTGAAAVRKYSYQKSLALWAQD